VKCVNTNLCVYQCCVCMWYVAAQNMLECTQNPKRKLADRSCCGSQNLQVQGSLLGKIFHMHAKQPQSMTCS
jgi:hypothetical protein